MIQRYQYCTNTKFFIIRARKFVRAGYETKLGQASLAAPLLGGQHSAPCSSCAWQGAPWVSPCACCERRGAFLCPSPCLPCFSPCPFCLLASKIAIFGVHNAEVYIFSYVSKFDLCVGFLCYSHRLRSITYRDYLLSRVARLHRCKDVRIDRGCKCNDNTPKVKIRV
eukprot:SAG11_NODE_2214_length_3680_cov_33.077632_3_plen_167_part_00